MKRHRRPGAPAGAGFTLIELLVVIAIIAILAAILFPVFAQAREKARQTVCTSRMKDFGMANNMYLQDYDEFFPAYTGGPDPSWMGKLKPYLARTVGQTSGGPADRGGPFNICPAYKIEDRLPAARQTFLQTQALNRRQDYGMNVMLIHPASQWGGPKNLAALTRGAASVPLIVESYDDIQPTSYQSLRYNHSEGKIITYADGHVKWMKRGTIPLTGNMAIPTDPFYGYL
jgi:prepilin-type N-terminal cleavage/methylation domain-containing protein/prepilin-type processing-associated H-X9-DG protein